MQAVACFFPPTDFLNYGKDGNNAYEIATLKKWLRDMMLIREFEVRCMQSYQEKKIGGFCHVYIGQEAVAVGCTQAVTPADPIVTAYRDHGHALARGMTSRACMAEMFGRIDGCAKGKGGSMHMFDKPNNSAFDTISFNIPGTPPFTIAPASALPTITDSVFIDGYSQPSSVTNASATGFNGSPAIRLVGSGAGSNVDGLKFTSAGNTVMPGCASSRPAPHAAIYARATRAATTSRG